MKLVSLATAPGQLLDAPAAASWDRVAREVQRRYGWLPVLTDSVRPYAEQVRIFLDRYDQQAAGSGYYGDVRSWEGRRYVRRRYRKSDGAPAAAAAPPGTSRHGLGLAVDCSGLGGFAGTRYRQLMSVQQEHGWSNAVGRTINEAWHQEYTRANDRHAGTGGGAAVAPTPTPPTSEEDDDMPLTDADLDKIEQRVWGHKPTGNSTASELLAHIKMRLSNGTAGDRPLPEVAEVLAAVREIPGAILGYKPTGHSTIAELVTHIKMRLSNGSKPDAAGLSEVAELRAEMVEGFAALGRKIEEGQR